MNGTCLVVFPTKDREASGVKSGDTVDVTLELDSGYREVDVPEELTSALDSAELSQVFHDLIYFKRKEYAHMVKKAKAEDTRNRRITKIVQILGS